MPAPAMQQSGAEENDWLHGGTIARSLTSSGAASRKFGSFINSADVPKKELIIGVELFPHVLTDALQVLDSQILYMLPPVLTHE